MNNRFSAMDENNGEGRMDKVTLSEATREKVEEATLSVFMEQYGAAMDAGVEIKMAECADMEFPPELDKRIQKLIANEQAKKRNKQRRKTVLRVLRSAAAVIIVLLSVSSILFMSVEAFRVPIINFFVEKHDGYLELGASRTVDDIPSEFNPDDPLTGILPEEYVLTEVSNNWEMGMVYASYSSDINTYIFFSVEPAQSIALMDKEDAEVNHFKINDCDAYLFSEGDRIRLIWLDGATESMFSLCSNNASKEEILSIAERIILIFT